MMDERHDFERQWKEWSETEPKLDERGLRRELLERLPEKRSNRTTRLVLVAAATSILALLIGYESLRQPAPPPTVESTEMVYETGPNVILVLREGAEPIYIMTEPMTERIGE
jgi:hypothetical protein